MKSKQSCVGYINLVLLIAKSVASILNYFNPIETMKTTKDNNFSFDLPQACFCSFQLAEKLLELGADPNIGDCIQNTPLHR